MVPLLSKNRSFAFLWLRNAPSLLAAIFFLSCACWAQLPPAGDTTSPPTPGVGHDYIHSPVETVNPANGSVSIRIPVRIPSGRELTIPFSIAYDSSGAFYIGEQSDGAPGYLTTKNAVLANGGWSYTLPLVTFQEESWTVDPGNGGKVYTCVEGVNYVFQDPTGNRHNLGIAGIQRALGGQPCSDPVTPGGEGPILATLPSLGLIPAVTDGNGTVYGFSGIQQSPATSVTDRNGNSISISYGAGAVPPVSATDTLGRTLVSVPTFGSNPDNISVAGLSSPYQVSWTTASPTFTDSMLNLDPSDPNGGSCSSSNDATAKVASQIVLPNGQKYVFAYNSTYGMLSKITYPSGGYVRYVWGLNPQSEALDWTQVLSVGGVNYHCRYDFPVITDRFVSFDGVTEVLHQHFTYNTTWPNNTSLTWTSKTTTVTTSDLVRGTSFNTIYTYSSTGVPCQPDLSPNGAGCIGNSTQQIPIEQTIQYDGTSGSAIKTVGKTWCNNNPRELCSETTTLNDTGQVAEVTYSYNSDEQQTEHDEYDYGSAPHGPLLRKTVTNYASFTGAHIVDLPSSVITYDGSGTRKAETDSSYDQTALQTTSVVEHSTFNGARGNLTTVTKDCFVGSTTCASGNPTTKYSYYDTGQIYQMTDPNLNVTTFSYADNYGSCSGNPPPAGATNAYLTQVTYPVTNGVSHIESHCYDYAAGLLKGSTDENGQTSTFTYTDSLDRLTEANYPDGGETIVSYNDAPPTPSVTTEKKLNSAGQFVTSVEITNGIGLPTETELTSDPAGTDFTVTSYDGLGRVNTVTNPYHSTSDPTYGVTTYTYDALGRTTQLAHPDGTKVLTTYTGSATKVSDEGNGTKSVQRISQTDGLGRMISVCEVSSATQLGSSGTPAACGQKIAATGFLTTYSYDTLDNLLSVSQGSLGARTFTYDSLSRLLSSTNPESGTTTYAYDANGNVASRVQPEPNQTNPAVTVTTSYVYDALNRRTANHYSDATMDTDYNYDETSPWGFTLTNAKGRLTTEYDGNTGHVFSYDAMGRVVRNDQCTPQNCGTNDFFIAYSYDLAGDVLTSVDGEGNTYTRTYNAAGELTSLSSSYSDANHPPTLFSEAAYDAPGQLTIDLLGNGVTETRTYNSRLRMTALTAGSVYSLSMSSYAPNGDVLGVNDSANGTWTYAYDDFNRLIGSSCSSHCPDGQNTQGFSYGYDRFGNRWQQNVTAGSGGTSSLTFTGNNNRIDGYSYDAAGNLMSDGSHVYFYDAEHHLVQVDGSEGWCQSGTGTEATACYTYDAEGQRMRRTVPGSGITDDYLYDLSGHYITQVSGGGWWIRGEIYAGGRHLATYENDLGTPTTFFGDGDSLGTERVETAVNGTACETVTSLPFGDGLSTSGGCDPSAKYFEGKERDWESNLDNFGARFYSSQLGRWMSADWSSVPVPVPYANLSNPQTLNLYAMVADNPETFADLDGHQCGNVGSSDRNGCPTPSNTKNAKQGEGFTGDGTDKSDAQNAQHAQDTSFGQTMKDNFWGLVDGISGKTVGPGTPGELQIAKQTSGITGLTLGAVMPAEGAAARAAELAGALGKTKDFVTIAVTETKEGLSLISSSENALRPAVKALLGEGEIAAKGAGHAEMTGVNAARQMGLTPTGVAASRGICPSCAQFLKSAGIAALSALKTMIP